jgi:hypothetical protein
VVCVRWFPVGTGAADEAASATGGDASRFTSYSDKDGLQISLGSSPASNIVIVKGSCEVPASVRELSRFLTGHGNVEYNAVMHEADVMYIDGRVLARYEGRGSAHDATGINVPAALAFALPTRCDYWSVFRLPWPLWSRDFTYREVVNVAYLGPSGSWRIATGPDDTPAPGETTYAFVASGSFQRESCPELEASHKFVRGNLALGGYVSTEKPGSTVESPKSQLSYVVLADAKGSLPGPCVWLSRFYPTCFRVFV